MWAWHHLLALFKIESYFRQLHWALVNRILKINKSLFWLDKLFLIWFWKTQINNFSCLLFLRAPWFLYFSWSSIFLQNIYTIHIHNKALSNLIRINVNLALYLFKSFRLSRNAPDYRKFRSNLVLSHQQKKTFYFLKLKFLNIQSQIKVTIPWKNLNKFELNSA